MNKNYDIFATYITENVNNMIENSVFPDPFKQADIEPDKRKGKLKACKHFTQPIWNL